MKRLKVGGHRKFKNPNKINNFYYALVDDEDFDWLNQWKWGRNNYGYAVRSYYYSKGNKWKTIGMAMEIMKKYGLYDPDKFIDHINRSRLDNRKSNLRMATRSQNGMNSRIPKNNTLGYKGIYFVKNSKINPWAAQITYNNKPIRIGCYPTKEEAAKAYDEVAVKYFGEFASLNFKQ